MTRITFARHAESELNLTPEFIVGRSNHARLTERGLYQASLLGAYFRENGIVFDAIYSSGAVRADQTAQGVIDAAGYAATLSLSPADDMRHGVYPKPEADQAELI